MESPTQRIEHLRELNADQHEPVRFRYLESLEQRLRDHQLQNSPHWQRLLTSIADFEAHYPAPSPQQTPPTPTETHSALAGLVVLGLPLLLPLHERLVVGGTQRRQVVDRR